MPNGTSSQVIPDYYYFNNRLSYQAAVQLQRSIAPLLSQAEMSVYAFIVDATARFGRASTFLSLKQFFEGLAPDNDTDFAGIVPVIPMSRKSFYAVVTRLSDRRLIAKDGNKYTLRLDVTPLTLAMCDEVQKATKHRNTHGGKLSTVEGIIEWATQLTRNLLEAVKSFASKGSKLNISQTPRSTPKASQSEKADSVCEPSYERTIPTESSTSTETDSSIPISPQDSNTSKNLTLNGAGKLLPYSFHYKNEHLSPNKLGENIGSAIRNIIMGKRSAADVLQGITASVSAGRDKVAAKRKSRRSLADMVALFESNWAKGQRDAGSSMPNRIVGRDRALIKSQLLKRVQGGNFDTDAFAYWVARHWSAIGAQYFNKVKVYPEHPVMPWFITCMETYILAYEQREYLDEEGSRSHTNLMRKAKAAGTTAEATARIAKERAAKVAELEAELRAMDEELTELRKEKYKDGPIYHDAIDEDFAEKLARDRKISLPDYDDPQPKKRLKRKRK